MPTSPTKTDIYTSAHLAANKAELRKRIEENRAQIAEHWQEAVNPLSMGNLSRLLSIDSSSLFSSVMPRTVDGLLTGVRVFYLVKKLIRRFR